ncbi:MAG: DMT family transporter [Devosia sp.]
MKVDASGLMFGAIDVLLLSCMDAVVKALGAELSTFQIVFARMFGAAVWMAAWIAVSRGEWPQRARIWQHIQRGAMLAVTAYLFFYAATRLPLAVYAALAMTAPVYVALLAALIFKEKLSRSGMLAFVVGTIGSAVIIFGGGMSAFEGSADLSAWIAAVLAPIAYALTMVLMKHHSTGEGSAAMALGQSLVVSIIVLPFAIADIPALTPTLIWQVPLVGFLGAVGFLFFITGLRRLPISVFAVVDYSGLFWAGVLGFIFFAEVPGPQLWVGGVLIIAACVLSTRAPVEKEVPQTH